MTFLHCFSSNDTNGGTIFYIGNNSYLMKESVTSGYGITFPCYIPHSGKPVENKKMKYITQIGMCEIRQKVTKDEFLCIKLLDGEFIVRKSEFDSIKEISNLKFDISLMSKKDFFPICCILRNHPTYKLIPELQNGLQILCCSDNIYDIVVDGWYSTIDEAIYYSNNNDNEIFATIHYDNYIFSDLTYDKYVECLLDIFDIALENIQKGKNIITPLNFPFISHGKLELFDGSAEYIHVAWRSKY
jgi:hypothetical protein